MKPNRYQVDIFTCYNTTKKNIFIGAGPGSGKTSTILELLKQTPFYKKSIFLAFNKSISEETKMKVNGKAEVSTVHSLSYRLLLKKVNNKLKLNELKSFILFKQVLDNDLKGMFPDERKRSAFVFKLCKAYDLARMNLVDNNLNDLMSLCLMFGCDLNECDISLLIKAIKYIESYNKNPEKPGFMIDFTDMLWLASKFVKVKKIY